MTIPDHLLGPEELSAIAKKPFEHVGLGSTSENRCLPLSQLWTSLNVTLHSPSVSDKYLTAACNALCSVAHHAAYHASTEVRAFSFSRETVKDLLSAAHKAFEHGKSKPAMQVLDMLSILITNNPDREMAKEIVSGIAHDMVTAIFEKNSASQLKEACIVLQFVLKKQDQMFCLTTVLNRSLSQCKRDFIRQCLQYNIFPQQLSETTQEELLMFFVAVIFAVDTAVSRTAALKLFENLCYNSAKADEVDKIGLASKAIGIYVEQNPDSIGDVARDIISVLLTNSKQFHAFVNRYNSVDYESTPQLLIFVAILRAGRNHNFVLETELPLFLVKGIASTFIEVQTAYEAFNVLLTDRRPRVRLEAYSLLVSSTSMTPIPQGALKCIIACLSPLHDESDAYVRSEMLHIIRKLVKRLQFSLQISLKQSNQQNHASGLVLPIYQDFVRSLFSFLISELSPHVAYSRHILALSELRVLLELRAAAASSFAEIIPVDKAFIKAMGLLILDPFDDVRSSATDILLIVAKWNGQLMIQTLSEMKILSAATSLAALTNRSDHADALGRLMLLSSVPRIHSIQEDFALNYQDDIVHHKIFKLSTTVNSIDEFSTSLSYPLHGRLLELAYLLSHLAKHGVILPNDEVIRLLQVQSKIWSLSKTHLCIDSPEVENEDAEAGDLSGPKDLLAYAWRALRDSSLLMQSIISSLPEDEALLKIIGDMLFEQLSDLRHRGAFSTVAQTFVICCNRVRSCKINSSRDLIHEWYTAAINEIEQKADKLTRRSAGLPAIFAAILDPKDFLSISKGFADLLSIASRKVQEKSKLPQVHALNCLKDILVNSRFKSTTEPFIIALINLSVRCLGYNIWAIRNCGLMLFRACMTRLDSGHDWDAADVNNSLHQAGELNSPLEIAINMLSSISYTVKQSATIDDGNNATPPHLQDDSEIIFAALDLLGRLYIKKSLQSHVEGIVTAHLGSPIWNVREHAARTLVHQLPFEKLLYTFAIMLNFDSGNYPTNMLHGRILACRELASKLLRELSPLHYSRNLQIIINSICNINVGRLIFSGPFTCAAFLDLINDIVSILLPEKITVNAWVPLNELVARFSQTQYTDFAMYHRAISLFVAYGMIFESSAEYMHKLQDVGEDVLEYIFESLDSVIPKMDTQPCIDLLVQLFIQTKAEPAGALGARSIAGILQRSEGRLRLNNVSAIRQRMNPSGMISREFTCNSLQLFAAMTDYCWRMQDKDPEFKHLLSDIESLVFIKSLLFSARDELDTFTRAAAISAIHTLVQLPSSQTRLEEKFGTFQKSIFFFTLYDLLNDDDEDIRQLAVSAATTVCETHSKTMPCPYAARQLLRTHLFKQPESSPHLHRAVMVRLLGLNRLEVEISSDSNLVQCLTNHTFKSEWDSLVQSMNSLFVAEKQNLYVDDLVEIEAWVRLLEQNARSSFNQDLLAGMITWTRDGLANLAQISKPHVETSQTDADGDKELGSADIDFVNKLMHPEVSILCFRLMAVCYLLVHITSRKEQKTIYGTFRHQDIAELLIELRIVFQQCHMSQRVVQMMDRSLSRLHFQPS